MKQDLADNTTLSIVDEKVYLCWALMNLLLVFVHHSSSLRTMAVPMFHIFLVFRSTHFNAARDIGSSVLRAPHPRIIRMVLLSWCSSLFALHRLSSSLSHS